MIIFKKGEKLKLLKDKFIHDNLGIPIQTLQNWKKSEGSTLLLYNFLADHTPEDFKAIAKDVVDREKYILMNPEEFATLVKKHWDMFDVFSDYDPIDPVASLSKEDLQVILPATHKEDSRKTLAIRFVSGMSKRADLFKASITKTNELYRKSGLEIPKIIYVSITATEPKYFDEYSQEISIISYSELFEKFSNKKILIV